MELRGAMESLQSRLSRAEEMYVQGAMQAALVVKERELEDKRTTNRYGAPAPPVESQFEQMKDGQLKTMITRLVCLEEELHREKRKMADKQKVIEAQVQTIQALDAANNRLLSALAQLRNDPQTDATDGEEMDDHIASPPPTPTPTPTPTPQAQQSVAEYQTGSLSLARRILAELGEIQSSSC